MDRSSPHSSDHSLQMGRTLSVHGYPLIAFPVLKTPQEAAAMAAFAESSAADRKVRARHPLRIAVMQAALAETEWDHVLLAHASMMQGGDIYAHTLISTEPLFGKPIADSTPNYLLKMFAKLVAQFNGEAWTKYSDWVGEEITGMLSHFHPEDLEEYQLQARLEDFLHEIRSTILSDLRNRMRQAVSEEYAILEKGDDAALREKEKVIIFCREKIKDLLDAQKELLLLIYEGVGKIESMHPELVPIKHTALLLAQLMTPGLSWSRRVLALQLLDQQLEAVSVVSGPLNDGRVAIVIAIRAALAEMSHRHPAGQVIEMCLGWDETNRGEKLADELRLLVAEQAHENAERYAVGGEKGELSSVGDVNGEWISFIPEKVTIKGKEFHGEIGVLVHDNDTGKIAGFTREGYRLLRRWGLVKDKGT